MMGLSSLERVEYRTSPENPTTSLSNPAPWLSEALGAGPTHSGVTVTERTALTYAACYACVNVLSKDIAQLPVFVYKRNGAEREADRAHDVWRVMHDRPNPMMTPSSFKQALQAHACAWGNGYAEIEFANDGSVLNLWPLLPDRTKVMVRDGEKFVVTRVDDSRSNAELNDGSSTNATVGNSAGAGKWVGLPADRVLHVMGLGFDGLKGYSVIRMARNAIGAGMAAEEFSARMFSNGASPRIALKTPNKLTPDARTNLKMSWDAAYAGLSNSHRTAVLEEGLTVEKIGLPAKDQQLIESSQFSIEQMARFFDIPLMRLHSTTAITSWGTGLEQWQRAYLIHTLGPWLVQWEESINWSLFSEQERPLYFAEFLREALLQGDMAAQGDYFTKLFQVGGISPNEIARKINMPSVGAEGDRRFVPMNMIPLDDAGHLSKYTPDPVQPPGGTVDPATDPPSADPASGADAARGDPQHETATLSVRQQRSAEIRLRVQEAYKRIYRQVAERLMTKFTQKAQRAVDRLNADGNVAAFEQWVTDFFNGERAMMQDAYLPATLGLGELIAANAQSEVGSHANLTSDVERFVQSYVEALAAREAGSSIGQLLALTSDTKADGTIQAGTAVERLTACLGGWQATRPEQIAIRESVQASNAVARHVYQLTGVQKVMWASSGGCEMCQTMNGRVVSITRSFVEQGETVTGGEKSITVETRVSHPPLHRGCVCMLVAA